MRCSSTHAPQQRNFANDHSCVLHLAICGKLDAVRTIRI